MNKKPLLYKKPILHKKRIQDLIDLVSTTDNTYMLHQLEILQIEIERDLIQVSYNTIEEFSERLNIK